MKPTMFLQFAGVILLLSGCSGGSSPPPPAPRAEEQAGPLAPGQSAGNVQPDDPRVVCRQGTTQKQDEGFGIRMVWCVDSDNRRHGPQRKWWSNGQLASEMTYVHGDADGLRRDWYENGRLEFEETYRTGKSEGKAVGWHPNGKKALESEWRNGELIGVAKRWDSNGRPVPVTRE